MGKWREWLLIDLSTSMIFFRCEFRRSSGNEWRTRRKLLTPTFHFKTLDNYTPTINARCADFMAYLKDHPQKDDMKLYYEMQKLTLDIIAGRMTTIYAK